MTKDSGDQVRENDGQGQPTPDGGDSDNGVQALSRFSKSVFEIVFILFAATLIFLTCFVSAIAVTEIAARITTRTIVADRLSELNGIVANTFFASDAYLTAAQTEVAQVSVDSNSKPELTEAVVARLQATQASFSNAVRRLESNQFEIDRLKSIQLSLNLLEASGTTTRSIERYDQASGGVFKVKEKVSLTALRAQLIQAELDESENNHWMGLITDWSTDLVLAIALISAGLLGAVISGLRVAYAEAEKTSGSLATASRLPSAWMGSSFIKDIVIGAGAGFMTFLVLKGGKFLFVVESVGAQIQTNPYGSAFAAVLAGLFTERAYKFLSTIVDQSIDRITSASDTKEPPPPAGDNMELEPQEPRQDPRANAYT